MLREACTGSVGYRFDKVQVVLRRDNGHVPHIGGQEGQLGLHVNAGAIPAQQRVDGKTVPLIPRAE